MSEKTKKAKYRASKTADAVEARFDGVAKQLNAKERAAVLQFGYECAGVKADVIRNRLEHYHRAADIFGTPTAQQLPPHERMGGR